MTVRQWLDDQRGPFAAFSRAAADAAFGPDFRGQPGQPGLRPLFPTDAPPPPPAPPPGAASSPRWGADAPPGRPRPRWLPDPVRYRDDDAAGHRWVVWDLASERPQTVLRGQPPADGQWALVAVHQRGTDGPGRYLGLAAMPDFLLRNDLARLGGPVYRPSDPAVAGAGEVPVVFTLLANGDGPSIVRLHARLLPLLGGPDNAGDWTDAPGWVPETGVVGLAATAPAAVGQLAGLLDQPPDRGSLLGLFDQRALTAAFGPNATSLAAPGPTATPPRPAWLPPRAVGGQDPAGLPEWRLGPPGWSSTVRPGEAGWQPLADPSTLPVLLRGRLPANPRGWVLYAVHDRRNRSYLMIGLHDAQRLVQDLFGRPGSRGPATGSLLVQRSGTTLEVPVTVTVLASGEDPADTRAEQLRRAFVTRWGGPDSTRCSRVAQS